MKIVFTASNFKLEDNIDNFRKIIAIIKQKDCTLVREWMDEDINFRKTGKEYSPSERQSIWSEVKDSILKADLIIVEGSNDTFSMGYQTAFALNNKKPVLVITNSLSTNRSIINGEDNPLLKIAPYTNETLETIIGDFIDQYNLTTKDLRFNMLLDFETNNFLSWESFKTGKTKSKIIRELIHTEQKNKKGL